ncbi:hypothetical protein K490DRAFT_65127 [Saccharata proteae CBS 121410]|uniref:Nucleolar 27S pre-rRNA processing Urb2/Npa2 C-terminal domain-containing protein n=1 Tax=Saccharata proteae CBS 121410 TaxID=1314787 RepID=A0A9P4HW03_9PEZI|nr:hypothetical protein K490DRAFT_65127 [Saccharata proteae CBS 121410]
MAPNIQAGATPSLQRLLALDKDFTSFDDQLDQAGRIVGLANFEDNTNEVPQISTTANPRAEWVLRWLLGKLGSQESNSKGPWSRSNKRAWILLGRILGSLPLSISARLLNSNKFLSIVEKTLAENFIVSSSWWLPVPVQSGELGRNSEQLAGETAPPDDKSKSSRKRKRPSAATEIADTSKPASLQPQERHELLSAIARVLDAIVKSTSFSLQFHEAMVTEYMKSVLRTDVAQAARLLKRWIMAQDLSAPNLDSMLPIWELSLSGSKNSTDNLNHFSLECLMPAATLLSQLQTSSFETTEAMSRAISQLQALFARHVFIPARTAFFDEQNAHLAPRKGNNAEQGKVALEYLLQPLQADISTNPKGNPIPYELFRLMESLLEVAISCSNRSTPKKRLDEAPWLQHVFVLFSRWIEVPSSQLKLWKLGEPGRRVLTSMLKTLNEEKVPLDSTVLENVVRVHAKLFEKKSEAEIETFDWDMMAQIIASDPSIFMSARSPTHDDEDVMDGDTSRQGLSFTDALFDIITDRWDPFEQKEDDDRLGWERNGRNDRLARDIIFPLLKAFAQARDLPGFISSWHRQLKRIHKPTRSKLYLSTEWESKGLVLQLRSVLESSLTPQQTFDMIRLYSRGLMNIAAAVETAHEGFGNDADIYANMVILTALVNALVSDEVIQAVASALHELQETLAELSCIQRQQDAGFLARAWRLLARIHNVRRPTLLMRGYSPTMYFDWVEGSGIMGAIKQVHQTDRFSEYWSGVEAFYLVMTLCNDFEDFLAEMPALREQTTDYFSAATSSLLLGSLECSKNVPQKLLEQAEKPSSPVRAESVKAHQEAFVFDGALVLLQFPALLKHIPGDYMRGLLSSLWWYSFGERTARYEACYGLYHAISEMDYNDKATEITSLHDLVLDAMSDYVWTSQSNDLKNDFLTIMSDRITCDRWTVNDHMLTQELQEFSEEKYLRTPLAVINRAHREGVLGKLYGVMRQGHVRNEFEVLARHLAVMTKLMEVPNATSEFQTQPESLWTLAQAIREAFIVPSEDQNDFEGPINAGELDCLELFEAFVKSTLSHIIEGKTQSKEQAYLAKSWRILREQVEKSTSLAVRRAELRVIKPYLAALSSANILDDQDEIQEVLDGYVKGLCSEIHAHRLDKISQASHLLEVLALLDAIAGLPVKHLSSEGLKRIATELDRCLKYQRKMDEARTSYVKPIGIALARAIANVSIKKRPESYVDVANQCWMTDLSARDRHALMTTNNSAVAHLKAEQQVSLIASLGFNEEHKRPSGETMSFLNVLILSLKDAPAKGGALSMTLSGLLQQLCAYVKFEDNVRSFHALFDCIDSILREKHWLISQHGLESIIDTVGTLASPASPALLFRHGPAIYTRLCTTIQLILTLHRTRLGGRYHLLSPLFQALLRCLFIPDTRHTSVTFLSHPPWLSQRTYPLSPTHAAAFARLLTTLCSPTVSAVKGHRNASRGLGDLVDETKKAREYAGQYVVGILSAFCSCQLRGRVGPEVRKEITAGLWACIEVVGQDGLRAMNSGLGASERAVWRSVYGEWRRFGKWDGR